MKNLIFWFRTLPIRTLVCAVMVAFVPVGLLLYLLAMGYFLFSQDAITIQPKPETEKEQAQRESAELFSIWGQSKEKK